MPTIITTMLGLLGKFGGLLTGINFGGIFSAVWTSVTTYWKYYLVALLIGLQLLTAYEWDHTVKLLTTEKAAHAADIQAFKKAQADADAKVKSETAVLQKESKANADTADAKYTTLLSQYRINLLRYQANSSGGKGSNYNQLPPTQGPDGPGGSTTLPGTSITISLDDAGVCAINTARLQAAHDWALNPPKEP